MVENLKKMQELKAQIQAQMKLAETLKKLSDNAGTKCSIHLSVTDREGVELNSFKNKILWIFLGSLIWHFLSEANNLDIGINIADDLEQLRSNLNRFKKSGMGDLDIDIEQMDWVEDNRKVKAFFIYETSL